MNPESETLLDAMLERAGEPAVIADDDRVCVRANEAADQLFGVNPGGLIGRSFSDFAPPGNDWENAWKEFLRLGTLPAEWQVIRADGERVDVEFFCVANVAPGRHISFMRDISARKRTESVLRASEERYARLFHGSPAAIAVLTYPECVYRDVNRAFLEVTGFWRAELIGRRLGESGAWLDERALRQVFDVLERDGSLGGAILRFRTKAGELRDAVASFVVADISGERSLIATFADVTEPFRIGT